MNADNFSSQVFSFWGKLASGARGYHPQLCHMIDVGMVTREIWCNVYPPVARQRLADGLQLSVDEAERWIVFLAALHDLGKASPAFQLRKQAQHLQHLYTYMGNLSANINPRDAPHGRVTACELPEILQTQFHIDPRVARRLASIIGGHHGTFPTSLELDKMPLDAIGKKKWRESRLQLTLLLADLFEVSRSKVPSSCDHWASMEIAGLVSVADWIGSNSDFFSYYVEDFSHLPTFAAQAYARESEVSARKALTELGWLGLPQPDTKKTFTELFPDISALRPLQQVALEIAERLASPGIVIIEAPMGEGKTEAGLYLADRWGVVPGPSGLYVALPTQATSNQMFSRVRAFLKHRFPDSNVNMQLLHGHAALSAEFETMKKAFTIQSTYGEDECGTHDTDVVAAEWFTHRKRGLLAPFGVGTIDQALLAVLQTRHVFVRLFGLAHKTVIIDEVHAYDAYMSKLLERLLEWLAALGSPVVLLSATLPAARQKALLDAYLRGLGRPFSSGLDSAIATPYPRICWAGSLEKGAQQISVSPQSCRELKIEWISGAIGEGNFTLGERLTNELRSGGCAAVVCNTVSRAQQIYKALKSYFPPEELDLFHARYLFKDRDEREKRSLGRFGKEGATVVFDNGDSRKVTRPFRTVLVATQVIEQSLDLDFDLMVTELAPADLVLQRSGRLHRHQRNRPEPLATPTLGICEPERLDSDVPMFSSGSTYVYDTHILLRSWLALQWRRSIRIPEEIEELIENVYGEMEIKDTWSAELIQHLRATSEILMDGIRKQEFLAEQVVVPHPNYPDEIFDVNCRRLEEDEPEIHQSLQALTRLTEPSVSVVLLMPFQQAQLNIHSNPSADEALKLLRHSVSLSNRRVFWKLLEERAHPAWRRSALLRHHRLLLLDEQGCWYTGNSRIRLDNELGIVVEDQ